MEARSILSWHAWNDLSSSQPPGAEWFGRADAVIRRAKATKEAKIVHELIIYTNMISIVNEVPIILEIYEALIRLDQTQQRRLLVREVRI
jgi:hypothetical protein